MLPRRLANRGGARRSGRAKQVSPSHRPKGTAEVIQGDKARVGRLARPNASKKYLQDLLPPGKQELVPQLSSITLI